MFIALATIPLLGAAMSRATDLLDTASSHLKVVATIIDELTAMDAHAELPVLAVKLQDASFRAMLTPSRK
jgi:hypothetical protein